MIVRPGLPRRSEVALSAALLLFCAASPAALAQEREVPDTFSATTSAMTPAGVALKIDVLEWSPDSARAAVTTALSGDGDISKALTELPTVGYVWPAESPVGYAVKYAHRTPATDGSERVTFVTDKPVGVYGLDPWVAEGASAPKELSYSVIELYLDGQGGGDGTMSLAAEVVVDDEAHTVSLAEGANVLTDAKLEPKPYWADGS